MKIVNYKGASEAEKALAQLKRHGIDGYIRRTPPTAGRGCGFAIYANSDNESLIRQILQNY